MILVIIYPIINTGYNVHSHYNISKLIHEGEYKEDVTRNSKRKT